MTDIVLLSREVPLPRLGLTIWIDDVIVPALQGFAKQRLWTIWKDRPERCRAGSTTDPRQLRWMIDQSARAAS